MGFCDGVRRVFQDNTRDEICAGLQALGVDARIADAPISVIYISQGPIRSINIFPTYDNWFPSFKTQTHSHCAEYVVPDPRLGWDSPRVRIETVYTRDFPLVGRVVDLRWKGVDSGFGFLVTMRSDLGKRIIERLNNDPELKNPIIESRNMLIGGSVEIRASGDDHCWTIETETSCPPSKELWNCYQRIAQHLLAEG